MSCTLIESSSGVNECVEARTCACCGDLAFDESLLPRGYCAQHNSQRKRYISSAMRRGTGTLQTAMYYSISRFSKRYQSRAAARAQLLGMKSALSALVK